MAEQVSIFEEFLAKVAGGEAIDAAANQCLAKLKGQAEPAKAEHEEAEHEEAADADTHAKRGRHR